MKEDLFTRQSKFYISNKNCYSLKTNSEQLLHSERYKPVSDTAMKQ